MNLLLDTHFVLALLRRELVERYPDLKNALAMSDSLYASIASIWEIAIKAGLGKLDPGLPLEKIADFLERADISILDIDRHHAVAHVEPEPATRDPFDRMLLAQCKVEGLQLVTLDRALVDHPLAFRQR